MDGGIKSFSFAGFSRANTETQVKVEATIHAEAVRYEQVGFMDGIDRFSGTFTEHPQAGAAAECVTLSRRVNVKLAV